MKIMISWMLHEDTKHDTLALFSKMTQKQEKALMGKDVKMIGRWHNVIGGNGVAIFETENADALSAYCLHWNKYMDLDVAIVHDDAGTRALGKQVAAES